MTPIKVGLIDDGVDIADLPLTKFTQHGWFADKPLPEHRSMNTWYSSYRGHGTEMAKIIYHICPFVTFYVAKLDIEKRKYDSVAESAPEVSSSTKLLSET
jgi:hypothetical protein